MSNVLLLHLDGKLPNLALMRLAAFHRALGDDVELRQVERVVDLQPRLGDPAWGRVYGSLIFEWSRPLADEARQIYPGIELGGTGSFAPDAGYAQGFVVEGPGRTWLRMSNAAANWTPDYREAHSFGSISAAWSAAPCDLVAIDPYDPRLHHDAPAALARMGKVDPPAGWEDRAVERARREGVITP